MANIIVKLLGSVDKSKIASSLGNSNSKFYLPSFLSSLGESIGPYSPSASVKILNDDAVFAFGTISIITNASITVGDTYQVGPIVLSAVASGATGLQFNIGINGNTTASNIASALNLNSGGFISASSIANVVRITSLVSGPIGNAIPIILTQTTPGAATAPASLLGGALDTGVSKDYKSF
jgi:hypothetical protein